MLVTTMMIVLVIASLVTAAVVVASNHLLANRYYERQSILEAFADAGLELARARINGDPTVYPDSAYTVLESGAAVKDGDGAVVPGVKRWLYVGPTGVTSGQYGLFGSIVSVVRDEGGGEVIRRSQINQESFAKFAYFTDIEPTNISFGGGDVIFGPVHSNSELKIYSSGATFHGEVRTAKWVQGGQYGTFARGYEEYVAPIPMPATADLGKLQAQAAAGDLAPHQVHARPLAGQHPGAGVVSAAQKHQQAGDDVLGDRQVVGAGRRQDGDAPGLAGRYVDVVQAHAQASQRHQARRRIEQGAAHLGAVAHDQRPAAGDGGEQVVGAVDQSGIVDHVIVPAQVLDRGLVHELGDDDVGHGGPTRRPNRRAGSRPA